VLYELLTGRPPYKASSVAELARLQSETTPAQPSSIVEDIDPALEAAILRCLEPDPRDRPASALAVAAALPGADPLAAALAAGETPSPELVAAAGGEGALTPGAAWALLLAAVAGFALAIGLSRGASIVHLAAPAKPTAVLVDRARAVLHDLGYDAPAVDHAARFGTDMDYVRWVREHDAAASDRWARLRSARPGALLFWYRESPRRLVPTSPDAIVRYDDPAPDVSGMTFVTLDTEGRLVNFEAVPPQVEPEGDPPAGEPAWGSLFDAAGLDLASFTSVAPQRTPLFFADHRAAWEGHIDGDTDTVLRVEAAVHRGKPVYFELLGPWSRAERMQTVELPRGLGLGLALNALFILGVLIAAATLARRNLRGGRGDRRGASRLALYMFGVALAEALLTADHTLDVAIEWAHFEVHTGIALFLALLVWLLYLALEPFVRRRWPAAIIGWSRLIAGRVRDPRVGREILIGAVGGAAISASMALYLAAPPWFGAAAGPPTRQGLEEYLLGGRHVVGDILTLHQRGILFGMVMLFFMFLGIGLQRRSIGLSIFMAISTLMNFLFLGDGPTWLRLVVALAISAVVVVMFLRAGVLAAVAAQSLGLMARRITPDFAAWYGTWYLLVALVILTVIALAFRTALGGRPLFGRRLAEPAAAAGQP
jgi:serine/threonine-protein kinase